MRSTCSLLYSCLFPFSPCSLSSCNCKCNPNFLRLVCPCLRHEHTQYWRRGLVNFHASQCKTVAQTLNFLQIRRREGWPRSGLLSRMTPALETGRRTRSDWRCFSTQMLWLKANGLPPCLPSLAGTAYKIVRNLVAPASPKDKTYTELMDALSAHFSPKPLVIAERYRFHKRDQLPGDSIATYVAELRRFARHCNFGTNLEDCLRDRLVCGLSNTHIIKKLLAEKDLDLSKAIQLATVSETASRDAMELGKTPVPASVHKLAPPRQPLVMRWSLGRRLSLPRCTSLHLLRVDDRRRCCSLAHRRGLPHLQPRRSASVVVALVIARKIVSAAIWSAMHAARRDTFLAPVHGRSRMAQRRRVRHMLWRNCRKTTMCSHCTTAQLRKRTRLRVPERSRFGYIRR